MRGSTPSKVVVAVGLILCLSLAAPAWAAGGTTASQVFATASPSVVVVEAFDADGHALTQGSGVVIAPGVVVSNCHVFEQAGSESASVFYLQKRYSATLRYGDPDHDLCSFTVTGLPAPPVKMGTTAELKVGENAYAIGAPEGFDLTLSGGLISSLRKTPGGVVIQMTTPISPGSSGGGLFDSQSRLIGITSYYMKEGEQLNFALPVEWIKALPWRGKTPKELAKRPPDTNAKLHKGEQAELSGDYATALAIMRPLAQHGNAEAQVILGWIYEKGEGVPQDSAKAAYWYRKAATQGVAFAQNNLGLIYGRDDAQRNYAEALYWFHKAAAQGDPYGQYNLGRMYYYGKGVPQDYSKALYWCRKAGMQGHALAQDVIGDMYLFGQGVPRNFAKAGYWYRKAATQDIAFAQYGLGLLYDIGQGMPQDDAKAVYWYRKAATQGIVPAQYNLALMYGSGKGVPQNYVQTAKWLILAKAGGSQDAEKALSAIETKMTSEQIAEAQRLASQWWAAHHK